MHAIENSSAHWEQFQSSPANTSASSGENNPFRRARVLFKNTMTIWEI